MEEEIKLDEFHVHEAIDRINMVMEIISNSLESHPVIKSNNKYEDRLREIQCELYTLYQKIVEDFDHL